MNGHQVIHQWLKEIFMSNVSNGKRLVSHSSTVGVC